MFGLLLSLLVCLIVAGCLLAVAVALGYSLDTDLDKLAEARAYRAHKRELNAAVVARRVKK